MTSLSTKPGSWRMGLALALGLAATTVRGQAEREVAVDEWCQFLGNINASGLLEPAGSHGSIGLALAAGASSHQIPSPGPVTASLLEKEEAAPGDAYVVPRIWMMKGMPWPVDFGLSAGRDSSRTFTQASGFVQWTLFEAFARPAVSVRGGYGRLFGLPGTEISSASADVIASFGFLRYFTAYASVGAARHDAIVSVRQDEQLAFLLADEEEEVITKKTWMSPSRAAGLRIMVLPPFVGVTAETQVTGDGRRSYAAKLGIGL